MLDRCAFGGGRAAGRRGRDPGRLHPPACTLCRLLLHLQAGERVVLMTVFPVEHLAYCPMPVRNSWSCRWADQEVMHVEPALLRPPGDRLQSMIGEPEHHAALGPAPWEPARGVRAASCCPRSLARRRTASRRGRTRHAGAARAAGRRGGPASAIDQPARDGAAAGLRPRARAIRLPNGLYLQGRADGQPHRPGGHQRRWKQRPVRSRAALPSAQRPQQLVLDLRIARLQQRQTSVAPAGTARCRPGARRSASARPPAPRCAPGMSCSPALP